MFNQDRTGLMMNIIDDIINDLNNNPELQQIFGIPVSAALIMVADKNDLRIEDAQLRSLTPAQQQRFLAILDEVFSRHGAA